MLDTKIGMTHPNLQESSRSSRKSIRQKRDRRKASLMKKASEYSKMCDADVCLGIHMRHWSRLYVFCGCFGILGICWIAVGITSPVISIADSLRDPIIQHQVNSLTRTLASRETKSYLPLNRGETGNDLGSHGSLRDTFHPTSPPVVSKNWLHHLHGSFVYPQRERANSGLQGPKVRQRSGPIVLLLSP
jgi:hypothetical protein